MSGTSHARGGGGGGRQRGGSASESRGFLKGSKYPEAG